MWKTPVDKGSPRRYDNRAFERAIHYVFFKDLGRGGRRKAASKARSSWDRGRPLAPAYQLPKTHIQLESHKSCSKDYPSGRAMLSGLMQKHPSAKKTLISLLLTCTTFKAFSGRDAFIPHTNRKNQVEQKYPEVKSRFSLPLLHGYRLWTFQGMIPRTAQHMQNSLQTPVWTLCKLYVLLQSSTSPCPKCI